MIYNIIKEREGRNVIDDTKTILEIVLLIIMIIKELKPMFAWIYKKIKNKKPRNHRRRPKHKRR